MKQWNQWACLVFISSALICLSYAARGGGPGDEFAELSGWNVDGKGQASVQDGRLVADHVYLKKTFRIDVDKFPTFEIKIDEAASNYVIKASLPGEKHEDIVRTLKPGVFRETLPIPARGQTEVIIHLFMKSGRFKVDYVRFLPPPKRKPLSIPAGAANLRQPRNAGEDDREKAWYLENTGLTFAIWKSNGCVAAGWDTRDGQRVFSYCSDLYRLETIEDAEEVFEIEDEVVKSSLHEKGKTLRLLCRNPQLPGFSILKEYKVRPEDGIISKRMTFQYEGEEKRFLHWVSDAKLVAAFRTGGFYNNRDYHPRKDPFILAEDVRYPKKQPMAQQVYFYGPAADKTAGSYRIRLNDRIVGSWCSYPPELESDHYYTEEGWQFKSLLDKTWDGHKPSAEVHYTLNAGDFVGFHRLYTALPEYREANQVSSPDWVVQVKGSAPPANQPEKLAAWNALLEEGYAFRGWYDFNQSDYETEGEWIIGRGLQKEQISKNSRAGVLNHLDLIRKHAPRYKAGPSGWLHSVEQDSKILSEHPHWFLRDKEGNFVINNQTQVPRFLVPEHVQWVRDRVKAIYAMGYDYCYLDGGGFGKTSIDWPTLRITHPYADMDVHESLCPPGKAGFFNAVNGTRGFFNAMGFFEGFIEVDDWRALAIKLFEAKLYQQPGTWCAPLYLRSHNRQQYANYCVLLGLKPHATIARPALPLVNMAYELAPLLIRDVGSTPCWWSEKTELEAYALGFEDAFLITLLSHAPEEREFEVGFDPAKTALDPQRETYVLHIRTAPERELWANKLSEPEDRQMYEETGWSPIGLPAFGKLQTYATPAEAAEQRVVVRPGITELLAVTQEPGMIWSVNGHRKYFPFSHTRWGRVVGRRSEDAVRLKTDCSSPHEIATFVPEAWRGLRATIAGAPVEVLRPFPGLAVVALPGGPQEVVIRPGRAEVDVTSLVVPESVQRGSALPVRVEADGDAPAGTPLFLSFSKDHNPIYAGSPLVIEKGASVTEYHLEVPSLVLPGAYVLRAGVDGFAEATVEVLEAPWDMPAGWDDPAQASLVLDDVEHAFADHKALRRFEQTFAGNGDTQAKATATTIEAVIGPTRRAGYAHAGVEYENVNELRTNIAFTRPPEPDAFDNHPLAHLSFSVDYHTDAGYTKRVYFHINRKPNETFTARGKPWWGTAVEPESVEVTEENRLFHSAVRGLGHAYWDLSGYAPAGWDGRVIFGSNLSMAEPETRLFLRIIPRSRLETALEPGMTQSIGEEYAWKNITYQALKPIRKGDNALAEVDTKTLTLKAGAEAKNSYALSGIRAWNLFMPTVSFSAKGTTFLVVDYLSSKGCEKRVLLHLSGNSELGKRLGRMRLPEDCAEESSVIDLRDLVSAGSRLEIALGKYAYPQWDAESKKCLVRVAAWGPGSAITMRVIDNEDFWRF